MTYSSIAHDSGYADAINAAMQQHAEQLQQYGRLLAQAGMSMSDAEVEPSLLPIVQAGFDEQLEDFPNG